MFSSGDAIALFDVDGSKIQKPADDAAVVVPAVCPELLPNQLPQPAKRPC